MADDNQQPPVSETSRIAIEDAPIEERLRYSGTATSLHQKLISRLIARRRLSERAMSRRYDSWNRVDEHCRLYIDLSRGARKADQTIDTDKKEIPWARSIVVPMSYAILQVYLTQLMGIYTRRDPPLEIHGVGPEDVRPAKLMNAVIAYDQVQTNYVLELYTALQDAMKYGMGGFHDWWQEEYGFITEEPNPIMAGILAMLGRKPEKTRRWDKRKEYQGVEAWDPFLFFPDPRISLSKMQKGEFIGQRVYRGYLEILAGSEENGGNYFNVESIPKTAPKPQSVRSRNRFAASQMNLIGSMDERDKGFHAIDSQIISLIPEEWELGSGTRPEKWHFAWVDDTVIIRAHRADFNHDEFNFSVLESNIDTHVFGNQGNIENLDGLQRFMNWKYNCVSDDTEILTRRGWSLFKDLTEFDEVATVSPDEKRQMWFERPKKRFVYDHDGEMIQIGGGSAVVDCLVTPNHRMWRSRRVNTDVRRVVGGNTVRVYDEWAWGAYDFTFADDLKSGDKIPNTVLWTEGEDNGLMMFQEHTVVRPDKCPVEKRRYPKTVISYDQLASLIGWYVSEGHVSRTAISIKQKNKLHIPTIDALMDSLPRHVCRSHDEVKDAISWTISDRRIAAWFKDNCGTGSQNKKLPAIVNSFSRRLLQKILQAAIAGDGHRFTENLATYTSTSKELVDGLQIAALKVGWGTSVVEHKRKTKTGKSVWDLHLNFTRDGREVRKLERVPYRGKVYCVENSTHLLVTRRNGHVAVNGNSHVQNLIRFINNRMIYASSLVESFDVENPDAAMHVRLTALGEQALREGRMTIPQMIQQLTLTDVTGPLMKSLQDDFDFAMRMSGAADAMQAQTTSDKRTLGEIQRALAGGSARMGMHAMMMDFQGIRPLALRWVSNRQQYTEEDMYVRIAGRLVEEFGSDRMKVRPKDIHGNFDYLPKTGPEGGDPEEMADTLWKGLGAIMQNKEVLAIPDKNGKLLDVHEIIKETYRGSKIKNVEDFYRAIGGQPGQQPPAPDVRVAPDEEVERMRQAGNAVPVEEAGRRPMRGVA